MQSIKTVRRKVFAVQQQVNNNLFLNICLWFLPQPAFKLPQLRKQKRSCFQSPLVDDV